MKELWRRIYVAILEYRLEKALVRASKLQDKLIATRPRRRVDPIQDDLKRIAMNGDRVERVLRDLKKLRNELEAEDADVVPETKLWN